MKKIMVVMLGVVFLQTGCATAYHHKVTQENAAARRIIAANDKAGIKMLNAGINPRDVIKIRAVSSAEEGGPDGVMMSVDLLNLGTFMDTFKEDKIGTLGAISLDTALGLLVYKALENNNGDSSEDEHPYEDKVVSGSGNTFNIIHGNNITVKTDDSTKTWN